MEVTISSKDRSAYTVADIEVKGWVWDDTPTAAITIKPRDTSPSMTFDISTTNWIALLREITNALSNAESKRKIKWN